MPRVAGVYTLPDCNPVQPRQIPATQWANITMEDIEAALNSNVLVPSVNGVAFPATQVPSANANTLDDYEEGSWTPTLTFTTPGNINVVYSERVGRYTKIGDKVTLWFSITTTTFTHTTAAGLAIITGIPFGAGMATVGGVNLTSGLTTATEGALSIYVTSRLELYTQHLVAGTFAAVSTGQLPTGTNQRIVGSITYGV